MSRLATAFTTITLLGVLPRSQISNARSAAHAGEAPGGESCAPRNGDVNADDRLDLGDAVTILGHLFLGGPETLLPRCAAPAAAPALPATGQSKCYDADGTEKPCDASTCPGQDGMYSLGCAPEGRFVDDGDGTVLDTCIRLVWQKEAGGKGLLWCEALSYCDGLSLAGHDDWRLPNVRELYSLADLGRTGLPLDPVFTLTGFPVYWSSTPQAGNGRVAWSVGFVPGNGAGLISAFPNINKLLTVRAVRTVR